MPKTTNAESSEREDFLFIELSLEVLRPQHRAASDGRALRLALHHHDLHLVGPGGGEKKSKKSEEKRVNFYFLEIQMEVRCDISPFIEVSGKCQIHQVQTLRRGSSLDLSTFGVALLPGFECCLLCTFGQVDASLPGCADAWSKGPGKRPLSMCLEKQYANFCHLLKRKPKSLEEHPTVSRAFQLWEMPKKGDFVRENKGHETEKPLLMAVYVLRPAMVSVLLAFSLDYSLFMLSRFMENNQLRGLVIGLQP